MEVGVRIEQDGLPHQRPSHCLAVRFLDTGVARKPQAVLTRII